MPCKARMVKFSQIEANAAKCCRFVAGLLPILLPLKSLIIRTCCHVDGFPDLDINSHERSLLPVRR